MPPVTSTAPRPSKPPGAVRAVVADEAERAGEDERAEREVDEQHPAPARALREDAAEEHAGCCAESGDRAPDAERLVAVDAFLERRGHERERGRRVGFVKLDPNDGDLQCRMDFVRLKRSG
jgi:hypothetical protein